MKTDIRTVDVEMTVNEVVAHYPATIPVFNEYGIDSCCGGGVSLAVAAERDGVDLDELLMRLRACAETQ